VTESFPPDLLDRVLSGFPTPLGDALAGLDASDNAHEQRDRVVEVFRAVVRLLGSVALSAWVQYGSGKGAAPPRVAELLRGLRRRSLTDGQWVELLRLLLQPWAEDPSAHALPEMVELMHGHRAKLPRLIEGLLGMRKAETVAHGATGDVEDLEILLAARLPQLASALELLEPLWSRVQLAVPLSRPREGNAVQRAWRLTGQTPHRGRWRRIDLARGVRLTPGEPVLVDSSGTPVVALHPVCLFSRATPDGVEEFWVLDGGGRQAARYVAIPSMARLDESGVWEVLEGRLLGSESDTIAADVGAPKPFRGLESFGTRHCALFFGREEQAVTLANRIRRFPLVTVTGASGSGKSSLLAAGVLPELDDHMPLMTRPGANPVHGLIRGLERGLPGWEGGEPVEARLLAEPQGLGESLVGWCRRTGERLVLVVDQAEEVFTLCDEPAQRDWFASALGSLDDDPDGPVRVVLSVREDFFGQLASLRSLHGRFNRQVEVVTVPDRDGLLRTLVFPLQRFGYEFDDPALASEMVGAVEGEAAALALLQFCADRLWESRDRSWKRLTRQAYEAIGGVAGALTQHAEHTLQGLTRTQRRAARVVLLRLVTGDLTRAVRSREDLCQATRDPADADVVLATLVDARLVTVREDGSFELVHEALIHHWDRLSTWLAQDREGQRLLHALGHAAREWEVRGRPDGLLWRGEMLGEYRLWRRRSRTRLTRTEEAFVHASERAAQQTRMLRRGAAAVALLFLTVFGVVMAWQWREADTARGEAEAAREQTQAALWDSELERLVASARLADATGRPGEALARFRAATVMEANLGGTSGRVTEISSKMVQLAAQNSAYRVIGDALYPLCSSPDGTRLLAFDDLQGIPVLLDVASGETVVTGQDPTNLGNATLHTHVKDASFSADGSTFMIGAFEGTVVVWDAATGTTQRRIDGSDDLEAESLSPGGQYLVTRDAEGVEVRETKTGNLLFAVESREGRIDRVCALSSDGGMLVAGPHVVSVPSGDLVHVLPFPASPRGATFSPDSRWLATVDDDGEIILWDMTDGTRARTFSGHEGWTKTPVFDPTGKILATAGYRDGGIRLWSTETGEALHVFDWEMDRQTRINIAFSPDGSRLAVHKGDTLKIWHSSSGTLLEEVEGIYDFGLYGTASSPIVYPGGPTQAAIMVGNRIWDERPSLRALRADGYDFAVGPSGGTLVYWRGFLWAADVRTGRTWGTPRTREEQLFAFTLSPDGETIARATARGTIELTGVSTGENFHEWTTEGRIQRLAFTHDAQELVAVSEDGSVHVWNVETRDRLRSVPPPPDMVAVHTISSIDGTIATGALDGRVRVVDSADGELLVMLDHSCSLAADGCPLALSADGRRLLVACEDGSVHMWGLPEGQKLLELDDVNPAVGWWDPRVAIAPEGGLFAVASADQVRLHDSTTGRAVHTLEGHSGAVVVMAFSPDGSLLATGAVDRTCRVWDVASGQCLLVLGGHSHAVSKALFSTRGDYLTTGTWVGELHHWRLPSIDPSVVLEETGERTNLRVCRDSQDAVPVVPFPEARTVWAPPGLCEAASQGTSTSL